MFLIRAPRKKKKKKTKTDHVIHAPFGWLGPSYLHTTSILITLIERIFSRISSGTWIDEWSHSIKRTKLQRTEFLYHVNNATDDVTYLTAKMADTLSMVSQSPTIGAGWDADDPFIFLCETCCRVISPVIGRIWTNSCFIVAAGRHFGHTNCWAD